MRIAFTFRNMESSESMKGYASDKIAKLQKYLHGPLEATVTFSLERHRHCVDVSIHAAGDGYLGREEQEDMYASIDLVIDKLSQQLRRSKDVQSHRRREAVGAGE